MRAVVHLYSSVPFVSPKVTCSCTFLTVIMYHVRLSMIAISYIYTVPARAHA